MHVPDHVAIIMDGNGRWAERRGLPRLAGHKAGVNRIRSVVKTLNSYSVKYLTVYGFSTENWNRPEPEVNGIFRLLEDSIDEESQELNRQNIRMTHLGRLSELPSGVQAAINRAVALTRNNSGMKLCFAFNYGGRIEIVDAARRLMMENLPPKDLNEEIFAQHLYTAGIPDVDLVIRTGGEVRISNFLLWQAAYSEYYFTRVLWPDFSPRDTRRAMESYDRRNRRFGGL